MHRPDAQLTLRTTARVRRLLASVALLLPAANQDPHREPGLVLTLRQGDQHDVRRLPLAALGLAEGEPASARLAAGPFTAELSGYLNVPLRDRFTFSCQATGACEIEVGGQVVLSMAEGEGSKTAAVATRLAKGANPLHVRFTSPARGEARLRVFWQSSDVPREPLPPGVLTHDPAALGNARLVGSGREVIAQHRCLRCHQAPADTADLLRPDAADLSLAGARLRRDWLARWIADPRALRPGATMPRVFAGDSATRDARDAAAWLASLGSPAGPASEAPGEPAAGGALFAQLGCVACHPRPPQVPGPGDSRVSLALVRAKWRPEALVAFLRRPDANHPATAMPDFAFDQSEARHLAAFLVTTSRDLPAEDASGDAARGRQLVETSGCLACHALEHATNRARAKPWREVSGLTGESGCSSDRPGAPAQPAFDLTSDERAALAALAAEPDASLRAPSRAEAAALLVARLRCTACHELDGRPDDWTRHSGEVADLLPAKPAGDETPVVSQDRPALTWCGDKLQPSWLRRFLLGELDYRPRPWLHARMPVYRAHAAVLAEGLVRRHGLSLADPPRPPVDPTLAATGRELAGPKGFTCVLCHAAGAQKATAVFESFGVDFALAAERLRPEWFQRWMLDPQRLEPRTRMPKIPDEKGRTDFREILDGSAARQFDAIWHWLQAGRSIEPPRGQ